MKNNTVPLLMIGTGILLVVGLLGVYTFNSRETLQGFNFINPSETKTAQADQPISQNEFNRINTVEAALVDGFPFKINAYPGSKLLGSKEIVYDGKTSYSAEWASKGTVKDIIDFYLQQGETQGWTLTDPASNTTAASMEKQISFTKDNYKINIVAELENAPDDSEYVIDIIPL